MKFLTKRALKIASLCTFGAAATGGIVAGLVTGLTSSASSYDFIIQVPSGATTMNYLRDDFDAGPWSLTNAVEGLFSVNLTATASPVHQLVGISPLSWTYYAAGGTTALTPIIGSPTTSTVVSRYLAPGMAISATAGSDSLGRLNMTFGLRTDSYWSDGKQVTADDFVDSVKYVALPGNVSKSTSIANYLAGYSDLRDKNIKGNAALTLKDLDTDPNYSWFFSAPKIVDGKPYGGGVYATINRDPATGQIISQSITYTLRTGGAPTTSSIASAATLLSTYGIFYPVNRPFIESIGGYDDFGKDEKSFVSNGPFKVEQAVLDFQALYKPNEGYWDKGRVLNKGFLLRVISDTTTTQALFKTGKIGSIIITPDQYRIFSADPDIKRYITRGTTGQYLRGWFYNQDNGPGKAFTRNVHFRRALNYGIDRSKIIAAMGYDGSPPSDTYSTELPLYTDENGTPFRDIFLDPNTTEVSKSRTFSVNGFKQSMVYFDTQTLEELRRNVIIAKAYAGGDPQYNPELAKQEFALFEQDMKAQGMEQSVYELQAMLNGTVATDEQSIVLMDQSLNILFNGRMRIRGTYVAPQVYPDYQSKMDGSFDMWSIVWGFDTPDPFSYLRLWALTQDPNDGGTKYNVAFGSYLVYTSPKGFTDPDQFPMMDDMERIMGNPKDEASFHAAMLSNYGVDWVSYADWTATKERLLLWQEAHVGERLSDREARAQAGADVTKYDVSGVVNTNTQILDNGDLNYWFSDSYESPDGSLHPVSIPAITINQSYKYEAIMELVLRVYSASFLTLQSSIAAWAKTLIGAYGTGTYFSRSSLSQKLSYVCSAPPKVQWSLPGCEAITGNSLPIQGGQ